MSNQPRYRLLVNDEEQYSLWPLYRQPAAGWRDCGVTGTREECLRQVTWLWTDMRPKSLRH